MDFTPQMRAVLQAIWTKRETPDDEGAAPGIHPLNAVQVENLACTILKEQTPNGKKAKTVSRQSWYNKNAKEEWKAIRRAIDGEPPLKHHIEVERAIAEFGQVDPAKEMAVELQTLRKKIAEQEAIIDDHEKQFEDFRAKAYSEQYVSKEIVANLDEYQKQQEISQVNMKKEEGLRKKYQAENTKIRNAMNALEKLVKLRGHTHRSNIKPVFTDFSPKLSNLDLNIPDGNLIIEYSHIRDEAWLKMVDKAHKYSPDEIHIVFHRFNVDMKSYISNKLPLSPSVKSYIFFCFQPLSRQREKLYEEAKKLSATPPVVTIIDDKPAHDGNVIQFASEKRDILQRLYEKQATNRFEFYDMLTEGYHQIWIERLPL